MISSILKACKEAPNLPAMAKYSLEDCHAPGLRSLVLSGEPGNLLRVFMATRDIAPNSVALHNHKYDLSIMSLAGQVWHQRAYLSTEPAFVSHAKLTLPIYTYRSNISGKRKFSLIEKDCEFSLSTNVIPPGACCNLNSGDIHTVWCSEGSVWAVQEHNFDSNFSNVLGYPFDTGNLYKKMSTEIIDESYDWLKSILKKFS